MDINYDSVLRTEIHLRMFGDSLRDYREFWKSQIMPLVYSEIETIFETGGRGTWAPLGTEYAAEKAVEYPGQGVLRRQDSYYEAATTPDHPGSLAEVSENELRLGIRGGYFESTFGENYPAAHETGDGNLPARPVYELIAAGAAFEARITELGEAWVHATIDVP